MFRDNKNSYIMFFFFVENIIGETGIPYFFNGQARFFEDFPPCTFFNGFIELQMPAGKSPGSGSVGTFSFAQKHPFIPDNNSRNTDKRSVLQLKLLVNSCKGMARRLNTGGAQKPGPKTGTIAVWRLSRIPLRKGNGTVLLGIL